MKFKTISNDQRELDINWLHINQYVAKWKPGTAFEVEIVRRTPRKSDPLRKYHFGVVLPIFMEHLGYEPHEDELFHRQLKIVYFRTKTDKKGIHRNVPSVFGERSEIPVPEKIKFVEWVKRQAAKEGCYIPDPGEKT